MAELGVKLPHRSRLDVKVYTNSLAGIDELHTMDHANCAFTEDHFVLIGGRPLHKYRAVTGPFSERALDDLGRDRVQAGHRTIIVGIVTANWILAGLDFNKITLSASGTGHAAFKRKIIEIADILVVVAPFGKL